VKFKLLGEERREYILNLINKTGSVNAIDIAKILDISETTMRRDLNKLAKKGLVKRTYGGAINFYSVGHELKFEVQKEKFIDEKKKIALAAAELVEDGDVILIEAGTTGFQTALNIKNKKQLTIATNSCDIATLMGENHPHYSIILSGGILSTYTHSLVGPIADWAFSNVNVDKAFIGISGIDIGKGITSVDLAEAQTKKNIINSAKKVIALSDHSKIGHIAMNFVAPIKSIDIFITDNGADKNFLEKIQELGIISIVK